MNHACGLGVEGVTHRMSERISHVYGHTIPHNTNDMALPGNMLQRPGEITSFQPQSSILGISTMSVDKMNVFRPKPGVGRLVTEFKLSLLLVVGLLATTLQPLVP